MEITRKKILVVDKMHESLSSLVGEIGFKADYRPDISPEEVKEIIKNYEVLFVRSKLTIDEAFLNHAVNLKIIGRAGAGIDQLDTEALKRHNIALINAPEGNRDAVAEHALGMLLCLFNKLLLADAQVRKGIWDREGNRGLELNGKTVGIIGFGFMGQAFAQRLQGFGCRVLAYDKNRTGFGTELVQECSLEEIWEETDVLSLHIPLNAENRGFINKEFLEKFRRNIWLINTARGEILPLQDLRATLESGRLMGAVLDVLENEKLHSLTPIQKESFDYIVNSGRVVLSPHVAGWTHESYEKINRVLVEKLKNLL